MLKNKQDFLGVSGNESLHRTFTNTLEHTHRKSCHRHSFPTSAPRVLPRWNGIERDGAPWSEKQIDIMNTSIIYRYTEFRQRRRPAANVSRLSPRGWWTPQTQTRTKLVVVVEWMSLSALWWWGGLGDGFGRPKRSQHVPSLLSNILQVPLWGQTALSLSMWARRGGGARKMNGLHGSLWNQMTLIYGNMSGRCIIKRNLA